MGKTVYIVDDEEQGRIALQKIIQKYTNLELVGTSANKTEAVKNIPDKNPELVLLDIHLGDGTGFEVLQELEKKPKVIFVTAFDEYAIKAFKFSAVDYILKPVNPLELIEAVKKAEKQLNENHIPEQQITQNSSFEKLVLPSQKGFEVVSIENIIAIQSDNNYSVFYLLSNEQKVVSKTLKYYDEILTEVGFFRCHQKYLININHIVKYNKGEGGAVLMTNNLSFDVSRRKKEELVQLINTRFKK